MNRGRKIAAMVTQNEVNTQMYVNEDTNTGSDNWIDTGIEFDTNRLNGISTDNYDLVNNTYVI